MERFQRLGRLEERPTHERRSERYSRILSVCLRDYDSDRTKAVEIKHKNSLDLIELLRMSQEVGQVVEMFSYKDGIERDINTTVLWFQLSRQAERAIVVYSNEIDRYYKPEYDYDSEGEMNQNLCENKASQQSTTPKIKSIVVKVPNKKAEKEDHLSKNKTPSTLPAKYWIPKREEPSNALTTHSMPKRQGPTESTTRVFCVLPWGEDPADIEEQFFQHFAKFGLMDYHEVATDARGRLSYGFVQYYNAKDARRAVSESHEKYGTRYARVKQQPRDQNNAASANQTRLHPTCRGLVNVNAYKLHEKTCDKQYQLKKKEQEDKQKRTPSKSRSFTQNTDEELNEDEVMSVDEQTEEKETKQNDNQN